MRQMPLKGASQVEIFRSSLFKKWEDTTVGVLPCASENFWLDFPG